MTRELPSSREEAEHLEQARNWFSATAPDEQEIARRMARASRRALERRRPKRAALRGTIGGFLLGIFGFGSAAAWAVQAGHLKSEPLEQLISVVMGESETEPPEPQAKQPRGATTRAALEDAEKIDDPSPADQDPADRDPEQQSADQEPTREEEHALKEEVVSPRTRPPKAEASAALPSKEFAAEYSRSSWSKISRAMKVGDFATARKIAGQLAEKGDAQSRQAARVLYLELGAKQLSEQERDEAAELSKKGQTSTIRQSAERLLEVKNKENN